MKFFSKRVWKWVVSGVLVVLFAASTGLIFWAMSTPPVGSFAAEALNSTDTVNVEQSNGVTFKPTNSNGVGLVIYQGAKVPPASYAYVAKQIASKGYTVFIPQLKLNLAVFEINAASKIIETNSSLKCWVVGGHSLGGAMAAEYAKDNKVAGLVLWASYPASSNDLSHSSLKVASIYGTRDGLSTAEKIEASKKILPSDTKYTAIQGGNHAQFGGYGPQAGDNAADITLEDQQTQIVEATLKLLEEPSLCAPHNQ